MIYVQTTHCKKKHTELDKDTFLYAYQDFPLQDCLHKYNTIFSLIKVYKYVIIFCQVWKRTFVCKQKGNIKRCEKSAEKVL